MITNWLSNNFLETVSLVIVAQLFYLTCLSLFVPKKYQSETIKLRMRGYAQLKSSCDHCDGKAIKAVEHEVLLGMLKKVEAKLATMTTLLTFALSAVVVISFSYSKIKSLDPLLLVVSVALILPTYFSFRGIKQLDSFDLPKCSTVDISSCLQNDLMADLWAKEAGFRFARVCLLITSIGLLIVIAVDGCIAVIGRN